MIGTHLKALSDKAIGIEKRLFETDETLPVDKILSLTEEYQRLLGSLQYLNEVKQIREKANSKIVKL